MPFWQQPPGAVTEKPDIQPVFRARPDFRFRVRNSYLFTPAGSDIQIRQCSALQDFSICGQLPDELEKLQAREADNAAFSRFLPYVAEPILRSSNFGTAGKNRLKFLRLAVFCSREQRRSVGRESTWSMGECLATRRVTLDRQTSLPESPCSAKAEVPDDTRSDHSESN